MTTTTASAAFRLFVCRPCSPSQQSMYHFSTAQNRPHLSSGAPSFQPHCRSSATLSTFDNPSLPTHLPAWSQRLTPPPEMNSIASTLQPQPYKEHGSYYNDRSSVNRLSYGGHHDSVQEPKRDYYYHAPQSRPSSRTSSPAPRHASIASVTQSRKQSTISAIAVPLQIPTSVNSSKGSLAELAAEITCFFWFESASILDFAEDPASTAVLPQSLCAEALPTTGFRKWVTTILSTTQVAQNVILLALLFVYRLKKLNPTVKGKLGSEYRLLTVALMLGNKFLDDNTYTNKTWAEVSGISVAEVHIMEVEFLSNMKYNLYTSAEQWKDWQTLLGRFADYFQRATRPPPLQTVTMVSPLINSYLSSSLPSPPNSFQTSPPSGHPPTFNHNRYPQISAAGPTPRPSPLGNALDLASSHNPRKRSREDEPSEEVPSKRPTYQNPAHRHQHNISNGSSTGSVTSQVQGMPKALQNVLQMDSSSQNQPLQRHAPASHHQYPHLPPIDYPHKAASTVPASTWAHNAAYTVPTSQAEHASSQAGRLQNHQSPYLSSNSVSPTNTSHLPMTSSLPTPGYTASAHPSPSFFLHQRNSPYKPVRSVNTLLVPPPARAMQQPEHGIGFDRMHYQPLGRPIEERQQGRLPHVTQNQWLEGSHQKVATPFDQWPGFMHNHNQPSQQLPGFHSLMPVPAQGQYHN